MLKRYVIPLCLLFSVQVYAVDTVTGAIVLARAVVTNMVADIPPAEVVAIVDQIAQALSNENLCGAEAVESMLEVGIPFGMALSSIINACNLNGQEIAALSRSLAPGVGAGGGGNGGPGTVVSP